MLNAGPIEIPEEYIENLPLLAKAAIVLLFVGIVAFFLLLITFGILFVWSLFFNRSYRAMKKRIIHAAITVNAFILLIALVGFISGGGIS